MKTIGLACDHAGYELKEYVKQLLDEKRVTLHGLRDLLYRKL